MTPLMYTENDWLKLVPAQTQEELPLILITGSCVINFMPKSMVLLQCCS